jgi:hypothetical protein
MQYPDGDIDSFNLDDTDLFLEVSDIDSCYYISKKTGAKYIKGAHWVYLGNEPLDWDLDKSLDWHIEEHISIALSQGFHLLNVGPELEEKLDDYYNDIEWFLEKNIIPPDEDTILICA